MQSSSNYVEGSGASVKLVSSENFPKGKDKVTAKVTLLKDGKKVKDVTVTILRTEAEIVDYKPTGWSLGSLPTLAAVEEGIELSDYPDLMNYVTEVDIAEYINFTPKIPENANMETVNALYDGIQVTVTSGANLVKKSGTTIKAVAGGSVTISVSNTKFKSLSKITKTIKIKQVTLPASETINSHVEGCVGEIIPISSVVNGDTSNWVFSKTSDAQFSSRTNGNKGIKLNKATNSTGATVKNTYTKEEHTITIKIYPKDSVKITDKSTRTVKISWDTYATVKIPYSATLGPDSYLAWSVVGGSSDNEYDVDESGTVAIAGTKKETVKVVVTVMRDVNGQLEEGPSDSCSITTKPIDDEIDVTTYLEGHVGDDFGINSVVTGNGDKSKYYFGKKSNEYVEVTKTNIHLKKATSANGKGAAVNVHTPDGTVEIRVKILK